MALHHLGLHPAGVPHAAAAVGGGVAVEDLLPEAAAGHPHAVAPAGHRSEVRGAEDVLVVALSLAEPHQNALMPVGTIDPAEALRLEVQLVQGGVLLQRAVEVLHPALDAGEVRLVQQVPLNGRVVAPLQALAQLAAHEQQLLARMHPHITVEQAEVRALLPPVAGHFVHQRALAVDHLVVGQGQHEVLGEGVPDAERELVLVPAAVHAVQAHVLQRVVHPAHVPLHAEPQAAQEHRPCHHRPVRGLLRDGLDILEAAVELAVHVPEQGDRL